MVVDTGMATIGPNLTLWSDPLGAWTRGVPGPGGWLVGMAREDG
jgi:hypothetical protein